MILSSWQRRDKKLGDMAALNPRYTLNSESVWWAEAGDCSWGDLVLVCSKVNTSMASWDPLCRTLDIMSVVNNSLRINFKSRDALYTWMPRCHYSSGKLCVKNVESFTTNFIRPFLKAIVKVSWPEWIVIAKVSTYNPSIPWSPPCPRSWPSPHLW